MKSKIYFEEDFDEGEGVVNNPYIGSEGIDMTADMDDSNIQRAVNITKIQNNLRKKKTRTEYENEFLKEDFSRHGVKEGVIPPDPRAEFLRNDSLKTGRNQGTSSSTKSYPSVFDYGKPRRDYSDIFREAKESGVIGSGGGGRWEKKGRGRFL